MVDLIYVLAAGLGVILAAVALDLVRDQAKASTPWIVEWLRRRAVRRLPEPLRERVDEEWASWLDETPGPIAKLWRVFGFLISVPDLRIEKEVPSQADEHSRTTTIRMEAINIKSEMPDIVLYSDIGKSNIFVEVKAGVFLAEPGGLRVRSMRPERKDDVTEDR